MPRTKISEFSATPANNTDIDSINIAEGCAPSGINDAIRELMAQLKDFQTGAVGDSFNGPIGTSTAAAGAFTTLSASGTATLSGLTASTALALDASKNVVSVTNTGTGSNVLATSPTLVTPALGTPSALVGTNITGTASGLTAGNVTTNANLTGAVTSVGNATSLGSFSSANLLGALTDETGTGSAVFATSPTLVTPILGTPTSATLTNATGLPIATGVSGLGTGIATALAVNTGSSGAPVINGGVLGTPSSGTVTNLTGTASININGTVGATTASTGAFTTLTTSSTVTHNGGTANGVTYLNGSKVLTSGSALVFDGANLGVGVTPSAWTVFKVMQLGNFGAIGGVDSTSMNMFANTFYDGAFKYTNTFTGATRYRMDEAHSWFTAPSGTAGNAVTFTQAMTLDANGTLIVGSTSSMATSASNRGQVSANGSTDSVFVLGVGGTATSRIYTSASSTTVGTYTNTPLILDTNSTERVRITSAGDVGIGTSSPTTFSGFKTLELANASGDALSIVKGTGVIAQTIASNTNGLVYMGARSNHPLLLTTNDTERMRILSDGKVGIGTTTPNYPLNVQGASDTYAGITAGDSSIAGLLLGKDSNKSLGRVSYNNSDNSLQLWTNGSERARITSSGNLLVGTSSSIGNGAVFQSKNPSEGAAAYFEVLNGIGGNQNTIDITSVANASYRAIRFWVNGYGVTEVGSISCTTTATAYNTSSDYRLKNTIAPMTGALAKVALLKPVTYKWNSDGSDCEGFIAHELAEVCPLAVTGEKDAVDADGKPQYQGIDTSFLVATLTAAIQEQQALIQSLKARLDAANL
jgi:hypothetical protein